MKKNPKCPTCEGSGLSPNEDADEEGEWTAAPCQVCAGTGKYAATLDLLESLRVTVRAQMQQVENAEVEVRYFKRMADDEKARTLKRIKESNVADLDVLRRRINALEDIVRSVQEAVSGEWFSG